MFGEFLSPAQPPNMGNGGDKINMSWMWMTESRQPGGTTQLDWWFFSPKHLNIRFAKHLASLSFFFCWGFAFIFVTVRWQALSHAVIPCRYESPEIALNCGIMLRECIRHEPLAKITLYSQQFYDFFTYVEMSTFDIASDAFATFKVCAAASSPAHRRFSMIASEYTTLSSLRTSSQDTSYWAPSSWSSIMTE